MLILEEPVDRFSSQIFPVSLNYDFFAKALGGRKDLGHSVIYYESECAWYFKDSDNIFKTTTPEKLANLYRALMMKCTENMPSNVHKLNLVHEWRSDKVAKTVVNRAKNILLAAPSFFSATSSNQRIRGVELHERIAQRFVSELLVCEPGKILMLHDAYAAFCSILKKKELEQVKRSDFKALVTPLIKGEYNVCLRNDLVIDGRSGQRGWKNVNLQSLPA